MVTGPSAGASLRILSGFSAASFHQNVQTCLLSAPLFADRRRIYLHCGAQTWLLKPAQPHALPHLLPPTCTDVKATDNLGTEVAINKVLLFFSRFLHSGADVLGQIKTDVRRPSLFSPPFFLRSTFLFGFVSLLQPLAGLIQSCSCIDIVLSFQNVRHLRSLLRATSQISSINLNQDSPSFFATSCSGPSSGPTR